MGIFKKIFRSVRINITKFLSKFQITKCPFFLIYNFNSYKFKDTFEVIDIIQPGDIILKTYDAFLTGSFIPGSWKHAALVVDNRHVIEAVTDGVQYNDIIKFCQTDHLMILRYDGLTTEQINNITIRAFSEIGKSYDFDFLLKSNKFYCSELVVYCYDGLLNITPKKSKIFGFLTTWPLITPTDLMDCDNLKIIFQSN